MANKRALRFGLVCLALLVTLGAIAEYRGWSDSREVLVQAVRASGIEIDAQALYDLEKEQDPQRATVRAARLLLAYDLEAISRAIANGDVPAAEDELRAQRLEQVRHWASEVLATRPASWEAAMLLGGARFLESGLARHALRERESWESPLQLAHWLSPDQSEPLRLLAGCYIRVWGELSAAEREDAVPVVRSAFSHPDNLEPLLDEWLAAGPTLEHTLRVMPERLAAWRELQARLRSAGDHAGVAAALVRSNEVRLREIEQALAKAERLPAGPPADRQLLRALELMRVRHPLLPNRTTSQLLERTFLMREPGPLPPHLTQDVRGWLDWAVDRCLLASCPFAQDTFLRLAQAAADLDPAHEAVALLAAGELRRAERQRLRDPLERPADWAPFSLLKALHLKRADRPSEAREALAAVDPSWEQRAAYWRVRGEVLSSAMDAATPSVGSAPSQGAAAWSAEDWFQYGPRRMRLEMAPARQAAGIALEVAGLPPGGAAIAVLFDGGLVGVFPLLTTEELNLDVPAPGPFHTLEVELVSGQWPELGRVRLHAPI